MIGKPHDIAEFMRSWMDTNYSGFIGWPNDMVGIINKWADVADKLLKDVSPTVTSAVQLKARQDFILAAQGLNIPFMGFRILELAFTAYATTIAMGMLPTYSGSIPVTPLILFGNGLVTKSAEIEANRFASIIYAWAITGTATNIASGVTTNWI